MNKTPIDYEASLGVRLLTAGTAACIADVATFPFDTAKVRLQIQGEAPSKIIATAISSSSPSSAAVTPSTTARLISTAIAPPPITIASTSNSNLKYRGLVGTISTICRQEGPRALYNGLSAGLQRQMCFASVRLGTYDSTKAMYQKLFNQNPNEGLHVCTRILAGLTTGGMAVVFAQPTDVVKVRFQAQTGKTKRYTSTVQAYQKIGREEGLKGLWKGAIPNIVRNSIVNVSEIVCYDIVKDCMIQYVGMKDNIACHFSSAVIAGFATTVVASPIDVVKTRFMNAPSGQYSGAMDCAIRMARQEGSAAFYKGFVPSFARISLWNIALWITYEHFKTIFYKPVYSIDDRH